MKSKTFYHGSTFEFTSIDVSKGRGHKDFGSRFYMSGSKSRAENIARRNQRIEQGNKGAKTIGGMVRAYLYKLELDTDILKEFRTKFFNNADMKWLEFVLSNRGSKTREHEYDCVNGPTTDDYTDVCLRA